jgi:hypothetical protein
MSGLLRWFIDGAEYAPGQSIGPMPPHAVSVAEGEAGTAVRWLVDAANIASLIAVCIMLGHSAPPFVLHFYAAGWFEERHERASDAVRRIEELLMRGDGFLSSRIFVKPADPVLSAMPQPLQEAWACQAVAEEAAVRCIRDLDSGAFVVAHVGSQSPIGRVWGTSASSWPCLPTGHYAAAATRTYEEVLESQKARYEQVLAALRFPDHVLRWVPYHRLVMPDPAAEKAQGVVIVSAFAEVPFRVL